jgi:hypothetical protein
MNTMWRAAKNAALESASGADSRRAAAVAEPALAGAGAA